MIGLVLFEKDCNRRRFNFFDYVGSDGFMDVCCFTWIRYVGFHVYGYNFYLMWETMKDGKKRKVD